MKNVKNPSIVGLYNIDESPENDTTLTPSINVIKSCIDTLTSKIAQSKVRPFFNCINGTFKDINVCKNAQQYFDQYFDIEEVNKKVSMAFRDACIFDHGVIYVDSETKSITKALPWQVFVRPAELTYNNITRAYYCQNDYPVSMLPEKYRNKVLKVNEDQEYVTYGIYYDTVDQCKAVYISELDFVEIEKYEGNRVPFIFLWYNNPIHGGSSVSVVDMLYGIQCEVNTLMSKVKDASQLSPALTFFLPDDATIKSTQLNNRVGNVITYKATSDMSGSPVTVATPNFIDSQYIELINNLKETAYEMVGISQLSAQSKKPSGLDSGVALQTMEDVESERFEEQLNQVIRCYVEIAKTCLRVFPKEETILPDTPNRVDIRWGDIVDEEKKMQIQFSAADSLSKDPSIKLAQLQQLASVGVIPQERIAQFMELPDLEGGYSLSNNAINAVLSVIRDCIESDNYEIPDYIPIPMLKTEIINTQLSLRAANFMKNQEDIEKLNQLYNAVVQIEQQMNQPTPEEQQMAEQQQMMQAQIAQQQTALQQQPVMVQQGQPVQADLDMQTGQQGLTGWDGRTFDQAQQGQMA
ncbi:MAG: hypothetical protein MJZ50_01710 [Treponema sp.]|nr:hypothetical protein [Treponema sp.]